MTNPDPRQQWTQQYPPQQPYQYAPPTPPVKRRRRWPWVLLGLLVLVVVGSATTHRSAPATTSAPVSAPAAAAAAAPPAAAPKPAGPATAVDDGTYEVGKDMVAGRYKTPGPAADAIINDCYWVRSKDDSGEFGSIISNGNATGPGSVTVKPGEFFQTSGGCTWTKQ